MDGFPPYANLVYDAGTMSWVRMTQPLVDSLTSNLYLAVDQVESLLSDVKSQQTTGSQKTRIVGEDHLSGTLREAHVHAVAGHNALQVAFPAPVNDAFGRVRVSDPVSIWDGQLEYNLNPLLFESSTTASATIVHSTASSTALLSVTTASGSLAILQTRQYHRYQPGKSQFVAITFTFGTGVANVSQKVGYFDAGNGIYLDYDGTTLHCCLRNQGSDQRVAQTAWNVDVMDGTGFSGITLDKTKAQILIIDLQWLGVGRVRMGFDIDGEFFPVHEFYHANDNVGTYMRTANLPIRYELKQNGTTGAGTMQAICNVVLSEGGFELERGLPFSVPATTGRTVATRRALLSIRPKASFNGLTTRGLILPESVAVFVTGNSLVTLIEIVYAPTFTGTPTWTSADAESLAEYSVHGDAAAGAFTGGTIVQSFFVTATNQSRATFNSQLFARLPLTLDIAGLNPRALSVVGTDVSGSATAYATLDWREVR